MNKNYPPFSVLMSLYIKEQPEYLNECLESLFKQSLQANEVIVVLDGPITQELKKILNKWNGKLPLILLPQEYNQGLGIALNIGLKACSHEVVFRMDTDDICFNKRFEKQIKYLSKNPDVDIISCFVKEFNTTPEDKNQIKKVPKKEEINSYIKFRNPINHMGAVYKKSKIIKAGGYLNLPYMEDYYLWLRAVNIGLIIDNIQEPLVYARVGNGMIERRIGTSYLKSEVLLSKEKVRLLGISSIVSNLILIGRTLPRKSSTLIKMTYKILRKI